MAVERVAAGLVEIFGDDRGLRNRRTAFLQQHRGGPGWIEHEEFGPPLPRSLLDQASAQARTLGRHDADESRMWAERVMK